MLCWSLILLLQGGLYAQTESVSLPPQIRQLSEAYPEGAFRGKIDRYMPDSSYRSLKVRVNLIVLQRADGSGNFQDNAEDRNFLQYMIQVTNEVFANLVNRNEEYYPGQNQPFLSNAKIEISPNIIFVRDERGWNNRNDTNWSGVPYLSGWYLDSLDRSICQDPALPRAINLYFTNDGQLYDQMVVQNTTTDYDKKVFFKQHAASEIPVLKFIAPKDSQTLDFHSMRAHIGNVWLKLWWKRKVLNEQDWTMQYEVGESIAHELGHLMGLEHTPDAQKDALMRTKFGGQRDYLSVREIAKIHQSFCLYPSLWQFVDAGTTYGSPGADWIIEKDETWDLPRRLYANLLIKAGATLTLRSDLYMPANSTLTLEPGARLFGAEGRVKTIDSLK